MKIIITAHDVGLFNAMWPASPIELRRHYAEFDRQGNLVDHDFNDNEDGAAALALIEDAQDGQMMERRMCHVRQHLR
jgi:hypothetical protein